MATDESEDTEVVEQREMGDPEPIGDAGLRAELPTPDERQATVQRDAAESGLDPDRAGSTTDTGNVVVEWSEGSFRHEGTDGSNPSDGDLGETRSHSGVEGADQTAAKGADDTPIQSGNDGLELVAAERDNEKDNGTEKSDAKPEATRDAREIEPGVLPDQSGSVPEAAIIGIQDGVEIHQGSRELIGGTWI